MELMAHQKCHDDVMAKRCLIKSLMGKRGFKEQCKLCGATDIGFYFLWTTCQHRYCANCLSHVINECLSIKNSVPRCIASRCNRALDLSRAGCIVRDVSNFKANEFTQCLGNLAQLLPTKYRAGRNQMHIVSEYKKAHSVCAGYIRSESNDGQFPADVIRIVFEYIHLICYKVVNCTLCDPQSYSIRHCRGCDGVGYLMNQSVGCTDCNGTGLDSVRSIVTQCSDCRGTGTLPGDMVQCHICHGSGIYTQIRCRRCKATGIHPKFNGQCITCRGTGQFWKQCLRCNGSGSFMKCIRCVTCSQTGTIRTPIACRKCDGSGCAKVPCSQCNGWFQKLQSTRTCIHCQDKEKMMTVDFKRLCERQTQCVRCGLYSPNDLITYWSRCNHVVCWECINELFGNESEFKIVCPATDCAESVMVERLEWAHPTLGQALASKVRSLLKFMEWHSWFGNRWNSGLTGLSPPCGYTVPTTWAEVLRAMRVMAGKDEKEVLAGDWSSNKLC